MRPGFFMVLLLILCGCRQRSDELAVFAASSLKVPLERLARIESEPSFRASYAGSQDLATQIKAGAPADVFLCAGSKYMDDVVEAGLADRADVIGFAKNQLTIAYRSDLKPPLEHLTDLLRSRLQVILAAREVPVGKATQELLEGFYIQKILRRDEFEKNVHSYEASDSALVSKLKLGEADAAIVYESDLAGEVGLSHLEIPKKLNVEVAYLGTPLKKSKHFKRARQFVDSLLSKNGQRTLKDAGLLSGGSLARP